VYTVIWSSRGAKARPAAGGTKAVADSSIGFRGILNLGEGSVTRSMANRGTDLKTIERLTNAKTCKRSNMQTSQALARLETMPVDPYADTRSDGRGTAFAPGYKTTGLHFHSRLQFVTILPPLAGVENCPPDQSLNARSKHLAGLAPRSGILEKVYLSQCLKGAARSAIHQFADQIALPLTRSPADR